MIAGHMFDRERFVMAFGERLHMGGIVDKPRVFIPDIGDMRVDHIADVGPEYPKRAFERVSWIEPNQVLVGPRLTPAKKCVRHVDSARAARSDNFWLGVQAE